MGKHDGTIEFIARVVWRSGDSILVCRNLKHGHCYLPGGHVEFGETVMEAAARELMEEAGVAPTLHPPTHTFESTFTQNGKRRHEVVGVCHVAWRDGVPPPAITSLESKIAFEWIPLADLAHAGFVPDVQRRWLLIGTGASGWTSTKDP